MASSKGSTKPICTITHRLLASAEAQPDQLYERGEGARAFERTASRLEEMRSEGYMALPHIS